MTARSRIDVVLRVRRVQELQAAGVLAAARAEAERAQADLDAARDRYDVHRHRDHLDAVVSIAVAERQVRELHARTIQQARLTVKEMVAKMEQRRAELQERSQAVKGLERLDERLAEEEQAENLRLEARELDSRRWIAPVMSS